MQEIGGKKRSPDMGIVNLQKEWKKNPMKRISFKFFIKHVTSNY